MQGRQSRFGAAVISVVFLLGFALYPAGASPLKRHGCKKGFFPATGQTTCWNHAGVAIPCAGTGQDGDIKAGKALRYRDNRNGTVTDLNTGLMWEKKDMSGGLHDVGNTYFFQGGTTPAEETVWDWLHDVNAEAGVGFAGHTDWRIPNVRELQSIVDYEESQPATASAFNNNCTSGCTVLTCSCTAAADYWSSTTLAPFPGNAWFVIFEGGFVVSNQKDAFRRVRAVRGGCVN